MFPLVSPDSGYYLSIARDFYNGQTYFIDIATAYNPLSILILGIPFSFFEHPDIRISLLINVLILLFSAYILYLILKTILSKQYGLFILAPIGIDILIQKKKIFEKSIILALGVFIPILIFYIYLSQNGATIMEFILHIFGKGVKLDMGNGTGIDYTFWTYSIGFGFFLIYNLYIILVPSLLFTYFKKEGFKNIFYLLFLPFSLLVLLLASYAHYFQYVLPYLLIAFVFITSKIVLKNERIKNILFFSSLFFMLGITIFSLTKKQSKLDLQQASVNVISKVVPKKSEVYLIGLSSAFYYLCDFNSIASSKIGYSFIGYFYPKTIVENMKNEFFLIVSEEAYKSYKELTMSFQKHKIIIDNQTYFILKKV